MELIKETVDIEEQNDLEELYFLWDEAIQLYELEEFPGDYEVSAANAQTFVACSCMSCGAFIHFASS
jgi:hypothetical protein